jgi:hypothetical protein
LQCGSPESPHGVLPGFTEMVGGARRVEGIAGSSSSSSISDAPGVIFSCAQCGVQSSERPRHHAGLGPADSRPLRMIGAAIGWRGAAESTMGCCSPLSPCCCRCHQVPYDAPAGTAAQGCWHRAAAQRQYTVTALPAARTAGPGLVGGPHASAVAGRPR